ncbi:MAG: methylmalonyl-CoA mutase [Proteobacteria bacterium]|nr:methylmalonyl-CoA mutase [Pseudomonadota bacterium]
MAIDRRLVGRALSAVARARVEEVLADVALERPRRSRVIGVTGSPGAGKSTLIGRLVAARLGRVSSLAVLAIDPTSPKSDGSLLGDRIRMGQISEDPRVFIRSLPSRAAEDGLTDNLAELVACLDGLGFDEIVVETVGAGQTAYGIRAVADVEVLVLAPGAGDYVQAMKAGILETADVYVVNKADLPGADRVAADLLAVARPGFHAPPVVLVRADEPRGIDELDAVLEQELSRVRTPAEEAVRERQRRQYRVRSLLLRSIDEALRTLPADTWSGSIAAAYARAREALSRIVVP